MSSKQQRGGRRPRGDNKNRRYPSNQTSSKQEAPEVLNPDASFTSSQQLQPAYPQPQIATKPTTKKESSIVVPANPNVNPATEAPSSLQPPAPQYNPSQHQPSSVRIRAKKILVVSFVGNMAVKRSSKLLGLEENRFKPASEFFESLYRSGDAISGSLASIAGMSSKQNYHESRINKISAITAETKQMDLVKIYSDRTENIIYVAFDVPSWVDIAVEHSNEYLSLELALLFSSHFCFHILPGNCIYGEGINIGVFLKLQMFQRIKERICRNNDPVVENFWVPSFAFVVDDSAKPRVVASLGKHANQMLRKLRLISNSENYSEENLFIIERHVVLYEGVPESKDEAQPIFISAIIRSNRNVLPPSLQMKKHALAKAMKNANSLARVPNKAGIDTVFSFIAEKEEYFGNTKWAFNELPRFWDWLDTFLENIRYLLQNKDSLFSFINESIYQVSKNICAIALEAALVRYCQDLPAAYPYNEHADRMNRCVEYFNQNAVGPAINEYRKILKNACEEKWAKDKRMCEGVSLTGRPCLNKISDENFNKCTNHISGAVFIQSCNCGSSQQPIPDPFSILVANYTNFLSFECCKSFLQFEIPLYKEIHTVVTRVGQGDFYNEEVGLSQPGFVPGYNKLSFFQLATNTLQNFQQQRKVILKFGEYSSFRGTDLCGWMGFEYECMNGHRFFLDPATVQWDKTKDQAESDGSLDHRVSPLTVKSSPSPSEGKFTREKGPSSWEIRMYHACVEKGCSEGVGRLARIFVTADDNQNLASAASAGIVFQLIAAWESLNLKGISCPLFQGKIAFFGNSCYCIRLPFIFEYQNEHLSLPPHSHGCESYRKARLALFPEYTKVHVAGSSDTKLYSAKEDAKLSSNKEDVAPFVLTDSSSKRKQIISNASATSRQPQAPPQPQVQQPPVKFGSKKWEDREKRGKPKGRS